MTVGLHDAVLNQPAPDRFTPPCLQSRDGAPVFLLRPSVDRGRVTFRHELARAGLAFHDTTAFRDETLRATTALWAEEHRGEGIERLMGMWAKLDAGETLPDDEAMALSELSAQLARRWPPIARMAADNERYPAEFAKIAMRLVVEGWEGIPAAFRIEGGRPPLSLLDDVEEWIATTFNPWGPAAMAELALACVNRLDATLADRVPSVEPPADATPASPNPPRWKRAPRRRRTK